MRKLLLFFLLVQVAPSAIAAKRITVAQLERFVAENHAKSDVKIAPHFFDLELTERLSAAKLAALEAALPGPESRSPIRRPSSIRLPPKFPRPLPPIPTRSAA